MQRHGTSIRLTEKIVHDLEPPATGNKITYDIKLVGFGVRITRNGMRSFVLNYYASGSSGG
jgi:hypothetical protein